jgi:hypothetical protein
LENTQGKVAKYRDLARAHRIPLAVGVGAHKFAGVTLATVDQSLQGPRTLSHAEVGPGDTFLGSPTTFEWKPVAHWSMPADLVWVNHAFPFAVTLGPNPLATIQFQAELPA